MCWARGEPSGRPVPPPPYRGHRRESSKAPVLMTIARRCALGRPSRARRSPTGFGRAAGTRQGRGAVRQASSPVVQSRPARRRGRMAAGGPGFRGFGRCCTRPCLYAVLALVTPAVAGAPAPDLPDWLAARLRATTAGPAGGRPPWGATDEYRGGAGCYPP